MQNAISLERLPRGSLAISTHDGFWLALMNQPHLSLRASWLEGCEVKVYRFDPKTFQAGLESHDVGGVQVKVCSAARTVTDCFKFRNKVGLEVALDTSTRRQRKKASTRELVHFAALLRMQRVLQPYLEALA